MKYLLNRKTMRAKKNFVLDTTVILYDHQCLENFQENDIYLPVVVLEELDKLKEGNDQINYNAREFVQELDLLTNNDLFLKGVSLGTGLGTLYVVTGDKYQDKIAMSFPERTPDHRILSCTLSIAEKSPKTQTFLVSKNIGLRMKARSLGIQVEDYIHENIEKTIIAKAAKPKSTFTEYNKRYQVFISSTFKDLIEERNKVIEAVIGNNCMPAGMEYFPATREKQFSYIKKIIDDCDFYILISAGKYGSLAEDDISYTEKEFDYAVASQKEIMCFLYKDINLLPGKALENSDEGKLKLENFRKKITDLGLVQFWENKDNLAYLVTQSLNKAIFEAKNSDLGWVKLKAIKEMISMIQ